MSKPSPVQYHDYLCLDSLLGAQKPKSQEHNQLVHDEYLFIIVHQIYELWFKQILIEMDSVLALLNKEVVNENHMSLIVSRLTRITKIQKILMDQIDIIETMTPLDFLEFRNLLNPASGFQSIQFRQVEVKMGLRKDDRLLYNQSPYQDSLRKDHKTLQQEVEDQPSLFDLVERWLERTPFLKIQGFDFWQGYRSCVEEMLEEEIEAVKSNSILNEQDKKRSIEKILVSKEAFEIIFDPERYEKMRKEKQWRLSRKALHAALFIQLYRDEPILNHPFRLLQALLDIDENFTSWRYRHALMALRMLGKKVGTGGSSGHEYLSLSASKHKVFTDFFNLTTFFIPRNRRPELPKELKKTLGYYFNS